jgi:hypothetical protein
MVRENKRGHRSNSELHEAMFLRTLQDQAQKRFPWLLLISGLGGLWWIVGNW